MTTRTKRPFIKLDCDVCKQTNYHVATTKGKSIEEKFEIKKFCKKCGKHTLHKMKLK